MADETITRDELAEALRTHQLKAIPGRLVNLADPDETAAGLFQAVIDAREPEYEPGVAYVDARGDSYLRSGTGGWVDYSTTWHPHAFPLRPLRRLVPESRPDLEAKLDRIVAICRNPAAAVGEVMGPGRHVPGDRLAAAVLAVVRGEEAGRG